MLVSIAVPSYNQGDFLAACLQSILRQEDVEIEVLVYDGGSNDQSVEIISRFAPRLAYWRSAPDNGQAAALRDAFAKSRGEILGWLNADDLLLPRALAAAVAIFGQRPQAALVYGDAVWIDAAGRLLRPKREIDFDWRIFAYGYCYLPQPAAFFRRDAYERAGGIDPSWQCCLDADLWHRICRQGEVAHAPAFWAAIRDHPRTKTRSLRQVFRREHALLRQRYLGCSWWQWLALHLWHRSRRVALRLQNHCYRPLSEEEKALLRAACTAGNA